MEESRNIAVLDLGSNSFHMLVTRVVKGRVKVIDDIRETVRLRAGLLPDGTLSQEARERALESLERLAQRLRGLKPENIRVVGTNTLRRARNTGSFLKKIEHTLGVPVNIVGGSEEARLIYLGVAGNLPPSDNRNFVIDIGGGSAEFIIGKNLEPQTRESRPIGCVGYTMDFFSDGIVTKKSFQKAQMSASREVEGFVTQFAPQLWDKCYGSSGTIKTIGNILETITGSRFITMEGLKLLRDRLLWGKPISEQRFPGLRQDRVPVFPGGLAVLYGIFKAFDIPEMMVSTSSLRDGLLLEMLGRDNIHDVRQETVAHLQDFYRVDREQARRVKETALLLLQQVISEYFDRREGVRKLLSWASDLHEIGLAVSHSGYHKHGAYILGNGDLDGFSQTEQAKLAFLVLNHRKRLKNDPLPYGLKQDWPLVFILRLAFILNRERINRKLPDVAVAWKKKGITLMVDPLWLKEHPLTRLDLEQEQLYWKRIGHNLDLSGQDE